MRLINTTTGQLRDFFENQRPPYAILSHTWGSEEISYFDYLFLSRGLPASSAAIVQALLKSPTKNCEGFRKIEACCKLARSRNLEWIWIDTCCIDKSSSAELSEAINSMYRWYSDAVECYVYLSDVSAESFALAEDFARARWFGRGWTLQELLAPKTVRFCNSRWEIIATKTSIGRELSRITGIPLIFLDGTYSPSDNKICSVAMKMSWLSRRQTTRSEDMAYCMFGLFDVNMPLIYGEGRKAFMRLQLEILKKSDDDSIYVWTAPLAHSGLLATWPTAFADCGNIVQIAFPDDPSPWLPPVMTSIGLEMRARYQRRDPHQASVDAQNGVKTITMAIAKGDKQSLIFFCGPCDNPEQPVTQVRRNDYSGTVTAIQINMQRFGATWQRIGCADRKYVVFDMDEQDNSNEYNCSYKLSHVEQQGL